MGAADRPGNRDEQNDCPAPASGHGRKAERAGEDGDVNRTQADPDEQRRGDALRE